MTSSIEQSAMDLVIQLIADWHAEGERLRDLVQSNSELNRRICHECLHPWNDCTCNERTGP